MSDAGAGTPQRWGNRLGTKDLVAAGVTGTVDSNRPDLFLQSAPRKPEQAQRAEEFSSLINIFSTLRPEAGLAKRHWESERRGTGSSRQALA